MTGGPNKPEALTPEVLDAEEDLKAQGRKRPNNRFKFRNKPLRYEPSFCQRLVDHMAGGLSFETFGAEVETGRTQLYEWMMKFPEFKKAKELGESKAQKLYETIGLRAMTVKDAPFNSRAWDKTMNIRFGWNSTTTVQHTGLDGAPIEIKAIDVKELQERTNKLATRLRKREG